MILNVNKQEVEELLSRLPPYPHSLRTKVQRLLEPRKPFEPKQATDEEVKEYLANNRV